MSPVEKVEIKEDDFDGAFAAVAIAAEAEVRTPAEDKTVVVEDKTPAPVVEKTPEELAAEQKAAADLAAAEALKNETPEQKTARETQEAAATAEAQRVADAKVISDEAERLRKVGADREAAEAETARLAAEADAKKETPEAKAAREAFEATQKPYELTTEEKAAEEKFKTDFPNEYAAVQAQFKATDKKFEARVSAAVQQVLQHMNGVVAPVAQQTQQQALAAHASAIKAAHSDFDEVIKAVPAWIKTQPGYVQVALQKVYDEGSTQDVIDLVADYKKAAGIVKPAVKTTAELQAEADAKAVADAAKQKAADDAAGLVSVKSKRTTPSPKGSPDMNDFDGAFAEAAAAA